MDVRHYLTPAGVDPVQSWLDGLRDMTGRVAIQRRLDRLVPGNLGDHKIISGGIWELRIDSGPGYRVYYGFVGSAAILLLCGGSKKSQARDIARAKKYWHDWATESFMNRKNRIPASRSHEEATIESLSKDPAFAAAYLDAVIADGEVEELLLALRRAAQAFGGIPKLAARAKLNTTSLYRALSENGNPEVRSLSALLNAMDMRLSVQPVRRPARRRARAAAVS